MLISVGHYNTVLWHTQNVFNFINELNHIKIIIKINWRQKQSSGLMSMKRIIEEKYPTEISIGQIAEWIHLLNQFLWFTNKTHFLALCSTSVKFNTKKHVNEMLCRYTKSGHGHRLFYSTSVFNHFSTFRLQFIGYYTSRSIKIS